MFVNSRNTQKVKSKRQMWLTIVVVLLSVLTFSCTNDPIESGGSSVTPDGKVLLSLSVLISVPDQMPTRATTAEEDQLNSLSIVVFDASNKLSQSPASATFNGSVWKVALAPNPTPQNIYAIANLSSSQRTKLENQPVGTSLEDLRAALTSSDVTATGVNYPFIMFSHVIQTVIAPTMGAKQLEMIRAVARIDVMVGGNLTNTDFLLESVTLLNAAKKYTPISATVPDLLTGTDVIRYNEVAASNNSVISNIYCYENNSTASQPTQLLIKGKYNGATTSGFYCLNVMYNKNNTYYFDIKRNNKYIVNITKVNNSGYKSDSEAISAAPSNDMITEIIVTDEGSHDILSNGSYYLGFSNSECLIYTSEAHNNELIATFTHNAPSGVAQGTVVTEGTELSLSGPNPFSTPNGTIQSGEIRVNIGPNFMSGNVIVKLGNLEKKIRVFRNARQLSYGGAFDLGDSYIYAQKLQTGSNTDWIKLSPNEDTSIREDEVVNPSGSIHMQLDINLKLLGGTDRSCDLMCARSNYEGRVRVKVAQYAFDIFQTNGQINNTYAGTFHRWNQVGERVIEMPNPGSIWVATVAAGEDFIKLAPGGSEDPDFGKEGVLNDAEKFPVPGNSSTLINTTPGAPILFRVGMRTPLSSANAQPRYGLILVSHAGGTNRIFVRQGEAPDYVMRKTDPIGPPADVTRSSRPSAVRFAAFHLTDTARTSGRVDLGGNKGAFVQYPSIGGYHFQGESPYGWSPDIKIIEDWGPSLRPNDDPCPEGYRRPLDGIDGNNGTVDGSEMRQSLWYYPRNGSANSDYYNTIRGAIADGYYDRLKKNISDVGNGTYKAIIAGSGLDAAFIGTIIFNPHTNASIFLPAAGDRDYKDGTLQGQGKDTYWWSGTKKNSSEVWYGAMTYFSNKFTFDNYGSYFLNGFSIRCVTEDNP